MYSCADLSVLAIWTYLCYTIDVVTLIQMAIKIINYGKYNISRSRYTRTR